MTEKSNLTPKRRFTKFQSDQAWTLRNLDEMAIFSKGKGYSKNDLTSMGKPIILYGRLYKKYETLIEYVDTFTLEKENSVISTGNEVIIPASGESSEDISRASVVSKPGIILGGDLNIVRPNNEIDPVFLALSISNGKQQKELSKRAQGKSVVHLHNSDLKEVSLFLPEKVEQIEIGNFFKKLDNSIILQQRKLEKTKALKAAYLSEMFPAEGELVPKRRFAGFTQEWEQRKLGEIMDVTSVKRIHQSDWTDKGVRFLRARDIVAASKNEEFSDYLYISMDKYISYSNLSGKVSQGDLLVTGVGTIGVPMLITDSNPLYFKDGNIIWFKNNNSINEYFFYYSFINNNIQKYIRNVAGIGTVGTYTIDSGKKTPILLPSFEEQLKIGNFFKQLDNIITLHQRKLEKLQNLKKAYLHEMFV